MGFFYKQLFLVIFFNVIGYYGLFSQQKKTSSEILQESQNEILINKLNSAVNNQDSIKLFTLLNGCFGEAKTKKNLTLIIACYNSLGTYNYYQSRLKIAIAYFDSSGVISRKNNLEANLAVSLMNSGAAYYSLQQHSKALSAYLESEKILYKIKSSRISGLHGNIALLYSEIGDLSSAKQYLYKSYPFLKLKKDYDGLAKFYNNLGIIYKKEHNFKSADSIFRVGLAFSKKNNLTRDISDVLYNLVELLSDMENYIEANKYVFELYEMVKDLKDKSWLKQVDLKLATISFHLNKINDAEKFVREAESIKWDEETSSSLKIDYLSRLCKIYYELKQYQKSAEASLATSEFSDFNTDGTMADLQQLKFKYEKQQDSLSIAKQQEIDDLFNQNVKEQTENKLKRQQLFIWVAVVGFIIIALFSLFLIRANRVKEKANIEILNQKKLISEKSDEITASINYAKHIQHSLLPTNNSLNQFLPNHFLIYLPKDIVSGDFYWLKKINSDEFFIAVADCTGHGVPGAIMSALSIQQLNEISAYFSEPSEILTNLNIKLKHNLNQDAVGFSKDGLDICLCKVNKKNKKINFSGANRSLWIFDKTGLKKEIKPTKTGIGGHTESDQVYQQTEILLKEDDLILLSTDGFADQFGGPGNKKITSKLFKSWITNLYFETNQKKYLHDKYQAWKNNLDQIDDVCVLGFKLV